MRRHPVGLRLEGAALMTSSPQKGEASVTSASCQVATCRAVAGLVEGDISGATVREVRQ